MWILPTESGKYRYTLWAVDFSPDIIALLKTRLISVNDLEMAGLLLEWLVLEATLPFLHHVQAGIECDNTSTVRWTKKFTAKSLRAGHLLWALALLQQVCRLAPLLVISIAGKIQQKG